MRGTSTPPRGPEAPRRRALEGRPVADEPPPSEWQGLATNSRGESMGITRTRLTIRVKPARACACARVYHTPAGASRECALSAF